MPFIPHTDAEVQTMLQTIGAPTIDQLFDEIPADLKQPVPFEQIPTGLSEMALSRLARQHAAKDGVWLSFLGAGAYEHHIPAAVWQIATRGEFYTSYTPYQPEASQGSLQLIYEFQTMMARLTALDVSNASLYDGASALAEAILMAVRLSPKKEQVQVLLPETVHPFYRQTVETIVAPKDISLITVPYDPQSGRIDLHALKACYSPQVAALVIPTPNFFGVLEEVDALMAFAEAHQLLTIGLMNPLAMTILKPPGQWGRAGVDMACGDGQPFGIPLSNGGPYYGFLCCKQAHVRHMPGRIVGRTLDRAGKTSYVLTLQAREQHIRRAKATSNICTNQGLMVTASTIYMSLLGRVGLQQVALTSHERTRLLRTLLSKLQGATVLFETPYFHEIVVRFEKPASLILAELAKQGIQGGYALNTLYPALGDALLFCATETKTEADIQHVVTCLEALL